MTAAGQLLRLPVLSPAPRGMRDWSMSRPEPRARQAWQHRLYRLPPKERQDVFCYGPNGYATPDSPTGTVIDIYA